MAFFYMYLSFLITIGRLIIIIIIILGGGGGGEDYKLISSLVLRCW